MATDSLYHWYPITWEIAFSCQSILTARAIDDLGAIWRLP
jgi:hypothetical protein